MVSDLLANAHLYSGLGPRIAQGLQFLAETDLAGLAQGRHELDGARLYALVSDYTPKPPAEGRWEAHRRYLDLQYVVSGVERMGVAPIVAHARQTTTRPTVTSLWLEGSGDFLTFGAGQFMILWPGDAHMPGIDAGVPGPVRKVVVKIAVAGRNGLSGLRGRILIVRGGSHGRLGFRRHRPRASPADLPWNQEVRRLVEGAQRPADRERT